jgi:hypothetical protein
MRKQPDPRFPLCWSLDSNIDPASSVLCQIIHGEVRGEYVRGMRAICVAHEGRGGFAGGKSFSARVRVWRCNGRQPEKRRLAYRLEIVREFFARTARDYRVRFHVDRQNPELKDRINCVSAIVSHTKRERRLMQAVDLRFRTGLMEKRCQWQPGR